MREFETVKLGLSLFSQGLYTVLYLFRNEDFFSAWTNSKANDQELHGLREFETRSWGLSLFSLGVYTVLYLFRNEDFFSAWINSKVNGQEMDGSPLFVQAQ